MPIEQNSSTSTLLIVILFASLKKENSIVVCQLDRFSSAFQFISISFLTLKSAAQIEKLFSGKGKFISHCSLYFDWNAFENMNKFISLKTKKKKERKSKQTSGDGAEIIVNNRNAINWTRLCANNFFFFFFLSEIELIFIPFSDELFINKVVYCKFIKHH